MSFARLQLSCDDLHACFNEASLESFIECMKEVPSIMANIDQSFYDKLTEIRETGFFGNLNLVLTKSIDTETQLKILRIWDFLVQSCSTPDEMRFLTSDGVMNNIILFPWDFSSIDLLRSYVTVLKGLSLKLNLMDNAMLYSQERQSYPLYATAVFFIAYDDSVTISAARLVVLNFCLLKEPNAIKFISEKTPRAPFEKLIESSDSDKFVFLSDLLDVAPPGLIKQLLGILREKLEQYANDMTFMGRAAMFLCKGPARTVISQQISNNVSFIQLSQPVGLGLLLFALEKKLIFLDSAIKCGLVVDIPSVTSVNGKQMQFKSGNFVEEMTEILMQRFSITHLCLILRLFGILFNEPPACVYELRKQIIDLLLGTSPHPLMHLFAEKCPPHRYDLDFLFAYEPEANELDDPHELVEQLFEVEAALGRWKKKPFGWFVFDDIPGDHTPEYFDTADGKTVGLTPKSLILPEGDQLKLTSFYISESKKSKRSLTLDVLKNDDQKPTLTPRKSEKLVLSFSHATVTSSFEAKIIAHQYELIKYNLLQE